MTKVNLLVVIVFAASACSHSATAPPPDVVGPFTGTTYRFLVDQIDPANGKPWADDLDGDGEPDDRVNAATGLLSAFHDLTPYDSDLLRAGTLRSVVEITTDDPTLRNDDTVGVRFMGADGETADTIGARLVDGKLTSNLDRYTTHPAGGTVHLPLFKYADPLVLLARGLEITLTPDGDGSGFSGGLRGGFIAGGLPTAAYAGLAQMVNFNPPEFPGIITVVDLDRTGQLTADELDKFFGYLFQPDIQLTDGSGNWLPTPQDASGVVPDSLSFAIAIHLAPSPSASPSSSPAPDCFDRRLDGDETDVDCGGSCGPCITAAHCAVASDCQSHACIDQACAASSCSDGIRDGFETGVDCGWNCAPCAAGGGCVSDSDCASQLCNAPEYAAGTGVCYADTCSDGVRDGDETDVDCGGTCPGCGQGQTCNVDHDCALSSCISHVCLNR